MLVGEPPHTGATVQAIVARVLTERPRDVRLARPSVPDHVADSIACALEPLPADRFANAAHLSAALAGRASIPSMRSRRVARSTRRAAAIGVAAGVGAVMLLIGSVWLWGAGRSDSANEAEPIAFSLSGEPLEAGDGGTPAVAVSPDGRAVVFVGKENPRRLYMRSRDRVEVEALAGTDGARAPFFSPDGKSIGFFLGNVLATYRLDGGRLTRIATLQATILSAVWAPNGVIYVGGNPGGLFAVPAAGGTVRCIAAVDSAGGELRQRMPLLLPDNKTIVFTRWRGEIVEAELAVASVDSGPTHSLAIRGTHPLGFVDGRLLYFRADGTLMAVPFDIRQRRATGAAVPVLDHVITSFTGHAQAALSPSGTLVYARGSTNSLLTEVRGSTLHTLFNQTRNFGYPRYSPDGRRIAVSARGAETADIWIYDIASGTLTRLTTEGTVNDRPEWTSDGKRVVFRSNRGGTYALWWQQADGSGAAEKLEDRGGGVIEGALSPDGRYLMYRNAAGSSQSVWWRALDSAGAAPHPFLRSASEQHFGQRFSPDGRWVAEYANPSGAPEIYVRPFADPAARYQVSVGGASSTPVWSRDGRRLFYAQDSTIVAATIATAPSFRVVKRDVVFRGGMRITGIFQHANFDVSPKDDALLLLVPQDEQASAVVVVHWQSELRDRLRK
jgi:serine/threonine-protein kinase